MSVATVETGRFAMHYANYQRNIGAVRRLWNFTLQLLPENYSPAWYEVRGLKYVQLDLVRDVLSAVDSPIDA